MIDTAGRLQNRADLMEELAKIVRVLRKTDPARRTTRCWCWMPPPARTRSQVEIFRQMADVSAW
jgi:fused signal recognition particle receptor